MPLARKHRNSGRANTMRRNNAHLQWVRGHCCCACGAVFNIQAAHVRIGTDGGIGMKPTDAFVIPLCAACHQRQHDIGERSFEIEARINMLKIAAELAGKSPHLARLKREQNDE